MKKDERFEVIYKDGSGLKNEGIRQILVDKETGVNYLLWQAAYSEFYVTPTLWPDFTNEEFQKAIEFYNTRERRFGKVLHE